MPFIKGQSGNLAGKPKGAKSNKTKQWEYFAEYCLTEGLKKFKCEIKKLEGKQFTDTFLTMLEYFQPKLARTEHTGEITMINKQEIAKDIEELFEQPENVIPMNGSMNGK